MRNLHDTEHKLSIINWEMKMKQPKFEFFLPAIQILDITKPLTKQDLLIDTFLIEQENELAMYYSPHNEYINDQAKLIIIGITPGWNQMKVAFEEIRHCLDSKQKFTVEQMLGQAKKAASFSGTMRKNLLNMLDQCGISQILHVENSASLFEEQRHFIHTTSVIKYPVFYKNKNYTGHQPKVEHSQLLTTYAYEVFIEEINRMKSPALIIPLGKMVEEIIKNILISGRLTEHVYLFGFPHPSGANGHRIKQFKQNKALFTSIIRKWERKLC